MSRNDSLCPRAPWTVCGPAVVVVPQQSYNQTVDTVQIAKTRNRKPKQDPHYPAAVKRAKEAAQRLQQAGIIDARGRRIRKDQPADMHVGQDRDFGG